MDERYQELARRVGLGGTERAPRLFAMIANEKEADLMLAMPADVSMLARQLALPEEEVQELVDGMFHKGLVFKSFRTDPVSYRRCGNPGQFHDATILWPEAPEDFLNLWQEFQETEILEARKALSEKGVEGRPVMRVIPVNLSLEARNEVLAFEDVEEIIEAAEVLAVTACTCKRTAKKCDTILECCLQLNNSARYAIARGTGRELTKQEALDLMKKVEEEGLIHTVNNLRAVRQVICNCCSCCCQNFPGFIQYGLNSVDPSRFAAEVDPEVCTPCEACIDRCFFGAIEMVDQEGEEVAKVTEVEKCMGCGLCQVVCPSDAITLKGRRGEEFVPETWSVTH